jgi:hypothetical protein
MFHRHRLFFAVLLGLTAGLLNLYIQFAGYLPNDFSIPYCGARRLIQGVNPCSCPTNGLPSNPLTTILAILPLAWLQHF